MLLLLLPPAAAAFPALEGAGLEHMQQLLRLCRAQPGEVTIWAYRGCGFRRVTAWPPGLADAAEAGRKQGVADAVGVVEAGRQAARLHDLIQLKGKLCLVCALAGQQEDPAGSRNRGGGSACM